MAHSGWPADALGTYHPIRYLLPSRITVSTLLLFFSIYSRVASRRHLLGTGRIDEARKVVAELNSVPADDPLVEEMVEDLMFGIRAENDGGKATWAECFSTRNQLWKRTVNGMMLQFIQQLNGQNFYCTCMQVLDVQFSNRLSQTTMEILSSRVQGLRMSHLPSMNVHLPFL